MRKFAWCAGATLIASGTLLADFQYQQSTKITGGIAQAGMRMAGAFSKQAREPMVSEVYVKGNRMAHLNAHSGQVIDLDKETITHIDFDKKSYSVMTFQQMKEAMQEALAKAKKDKTEGAENAEMNFKASVKDTKVTREISGLNTRDYILTLVMEGSDRKTGEKGAMNITSDMWMAPEIKGYQEVRDFNIRMAQKMGNVIAGSGISAMAARPDMAKGMAEMAKEMAKLKGVPVLTVTRMGSMPDGSALPAASEAPEAAQTKGPDVKGAAAGAAVGGALGRLGGLGGLGRKRKDDDAPKEPAGGESKATAGPAILMETTTESSGFSSASVDSAKFEVPAGFKLEEKRRR